MVIATFESDSRFGAAEDFADCPIHPATEQQQQILENQPDQDPAPAIIEPLDVDSDTAATTDSPPPNLAAFSTNTLTTNTSSSEEPLNFEPVTVDLPSSNSVDQHPSSSLDIDSATPVTSDHDPSSHADSRHSPPFDSTSNVDTSTVDLSPASPDPPAFLNADSSPTESALLLPPPSTENAPIPESQNPLQ